MVGFWTDINAVKVIVMHDGKTVDDDSGEKHPIWRRLHSSHPCCQRSI